MRRTALALLTSLSVLSSALAGCSSGSTAPSSSPSSTDGGADTGPTQDAAPAGDDAADAADASLDDPPIPAKYQALADAIDAERKTMGASGAAVALIENGQVTFSHGFGTKGPSSKDPVRARTLFRIGSMTKALTTTAFLSLAAEGKLDPSKPVTSAIPDLALDTTYLPALTLHDVLSHQSGLLDYLEISGSTDDAALSQMLTSATWKTTDYFMDPPETFWNYSNPNFYIAGLAVERAAGVPYRQAVQQRVLAPLGMTRTFFLPADVKADGDFSNGSSTNQDGSPWDVAPDSYENAWARPAGYAFSSVLDYARFVQFLYAGNTAVLPDAERQEMQKSQVPVLPGVSEEGYGYAVFHYDGFRIGTQWYAETLISHGGDIPGFAADFYMIPSNGFGIVLMANADGAHFSSGLVAALQGFAGLPAPTTVPADLTPDPTTYPKLVGAYLDPHNVGHVTIAQDASGNVTIDMPDVDAVTPPIPYTKTLTAIAPNDFVLNIQGTQLELTFVADSTGAFQWIRTRVFAAQRAAGTPSPGPKGAKQAAAPFHVDAAALRARLRAPRL